MDSIWVSEAYDLGSIPSKATQNKDSEKQYSYLFYQKIVVLTEKS